MTRDFIVRPMRQEDLTAVSDIDALCFEEPWPPRSFAYELTTTYSVCLVAEGGDKQILGAIVVWVIVDEAHIATIAVHPDHQNQGVGAVLLAEGLIRAAERGAVMSMLEVRVSNQPALALYYRFGYHLVGVREKYYQNNNEDALLLNLDQIDSDRLRNLIALKSV